MNYLYHWVPKNMTGDILYPLNELKDRYPEIYEQHKSKYEGREEIMDIVIPRLDCLWNDVLHFSAIHPKAVKDAITEMGRKSDYVMRCYEIDPSVLDPEKTVVYLYLNRKMSRDDFIEFKPEEIGKYAVLPEKTKQYYKDCYDNGKKPLVFFLAPHILYKGSIDIKRLRILEA